MPLKPAVAKGCTAGRLHEHVEVRSTYGVCIALTRRPARVCRNPFAFVHLHAAVRGGQGRVNEVRSDPNNRVRGEPAER